MVVVGNRLVTAAVVAMWLAWTVVALVQHSVVEAAGRPVVTVDVLSVLVT